MNTLRSLTVCIITLSIFLSGCQNGSESEKNEMEAGYEMIDRGEYDSAIQHFTEVRKTNSHPHVSMALASAYAGRAGMRVEHFWAFVKEMRSGEITEESVIDSEFYIQNKKTLEPVDFLLDEATRANADMLFKLMAAFSEYRERVQTVPYIEIGKRFDIQKAVDVLTGVPNKGANIYRATLNGVLLRSELDDGFDVWGNVQTNLDEAVRYPLEFARIFCSPVTGDIPGWLSLQFKRSHMITEDLQKAFPSEKDQYKSFSTQIESMQIDIPRLSAELIPGGCGE